MDYQENQPQDWLWGSITKSNFPGPNLSPSQKKEDDFERLTKAYTRCFSTDEGRVVLSHLKELTLERALGPESEGQALRQLEGQRQLVLRIAALVKQGQNGPDSNNQLP